MAGDASLGPLLDWDMWRSGISSWLGGYLFLTVRNSVACYHCASSGLVLTAVALSSAGHGWLGGLSGFMVRLTCHMTDVY